jgi:hypothetical protein
MLWVLQLVADALLAGYVFLLVQYKNRAREQRTKISYLDRPRPVMAPVRSDATDPSMLVLRRSASY